MSYADQVREYCRVHIIEPARAKGDTFVEIRSGDVHRALNFRSRYPLVCSAIGSLKFQDEANVERVSVEGPLNGANTIFKFRL